VPTPPEAQVRHRRRGQELESALLEAAWDELVEFGFANLTMESVAARARTGIAVLYRRWANKDQLVLAAIEHYGAAHPVEMPDSSALSL
jgi:AcrR family transcriptional regulator